MSLPIIGQAKLFRLARLSSYLKSGFFLCKPASAIVYSTTYARRVAGMIFLACELILNSLES